jgi:hypothetical protein
MIADKDLMPMFSCLLQLVPRFTSTTVMSLMHVMDIIACCESETTEIVEPFVQWRAAPASLRLSLAV